MENEDNYQVQGWRKDIRFFVVLKEVTNRK